MTAFAINFTTSRDDGFRSRVIMALVDRAAFNARRSLSDPPTVFELARRAEAQRILRSITSADEVTRAAYFIAQEINAAGPSVITDTQIQTEANTYIAALAAELE